MLADSISSASFHAETINNHQLKTPRQLLLLRLLCLISRSVDCSIEKFNINNKIVVHVVMQAAIIPPMDMGVHRDVIQPR
jgi:hypothetical protein